MDDIQIYLTPAGPKLLPESLKPFLNGLVVSFKGEWIDTYCEPNLLKFTFFDQSAYVARNIINQVIVNGKQVWGMWR